MSLKKKFFIIFLLLSTFPSLIVFGIVYRQYTIQSMQRTNEVYQRICDSAVDEANESISEIKHILESMAFYSDADHSIINDLKKYGDQSSFTPKDVYDSNNNLKYTVHNLIYSSDHLNGIFIFTPSGQTLGYGKNIDILPDYVPNDSIWYKKTLELQGKTYISGVSAKNFFINAKPSISFSKALYDVYSHELLGVLLVDCQPDLFDISTVNTLPQIVLLNIQYNGSVLYSNTSSLEYPIEIGKSRIQFFSEKLDMDGMMLTAIANPSLLYHDFEVTQRLLIAVCIIYLAVFFMISFFLSRYLTTPITYLSDQMANHTLNSYVTKEKYLNRSDEIGILCNEYNTMLEEQNKYIKTQYQNRLITLDSQMKSLEAQINSHFLYNTLESINSIAELAGIESISTMSMALGNMFRYSIKAKSELVTVQEELANVQDYVSIQQIRFANKFQLKLNIPEQLSSYRVLKLIFQPLVENALLHGLDRCGAGDTITITGELDHGNMIFHIQDNGLGMEPSQVEAIRTVLAEPPRFQELGRRSTQNIGLKNISSRIELYYGAGYGLQLSSIKGTGTTVSLKLPYIQLEEN